MKPTSPRHEQAKIDWASSLRQCTDLATLRHLHAQISASGHHRRVFLGNLLIQSYARCGSINDAAAAFAAISSPNIFSWTILVAAHIQSGDVAAARERFDAIPDRDVVAWNSLIGGYSRLGHCGEAIHLFREMDLDGVHPDAVTFLAITDACSRHGSVELARLIHAIAIEENFGSDTKVGSAIVSMYGKCGAVEEAWRWFSSLEEQTVFGWTAMLTAYAQNGHLEQAMEIFAAMPEKNIVSWNAILSATSQHSDHRQAVELFYRINLEGVRPSSITMICTLDAAASMRDLVAGARAHAVAIDSGLAGDTIVANALLHLYGECDRLDVAEALFAELGDGGRRDTMSWNVMIGGRGRADPSRGVETFLAMNLEGWPRPSLVTYVSAIHACASSSNLTQGKLLHDRVRHLLAASVILATAVVAMYGRCGRTAAARTVFDGIIAAAADNVAWSAMLAAYSQNDRGREALAVLAGMDVLGMKPSAVTYVSAIDACSSMSCLDMTKIIHDGVANDGFESNAAVASALVHAYGRCGDLSRAVDAFWRGPLRDAALWNALITAFAANELAALGMEVFREMAAAGVAASEISFVSVLSCCGHAGIVEDVWGWFADMSVVPGVDHYACLVDLLGRAGRVAEAEQVLGSMPYEPDSAAWTSFLDSCRRFERSGSVAAANALVVDPESSVPYVLLSNIHKHSAQNNKFSSNF